MFVCTWGAWIIYTETWKLNSFNKADYHFATAENRQHICVYAMTTYWCTSERKGTSDKARQKTVLWKLLAMKTKWNADNGKIYIICLTHNRTAFLNNFIFRYESQSECTWLSSLHSLTGFQFGWGGRIRTLGITESESAALPLGDTPIFSYCFLIQLLYYITSCKQSQVFL